MNRLILFIATACHLLSTAYAAPHLFSIGAGRFNVTSHKAAWAAQIEWKPDYLTHYLRPFVSCLFTEKKSTYTAAGLALDFFLLPQLVLTPSLGAGIYFKAGGKDLYYPLEFRSCIEAAFVFSNRSRLGAQFFHISNASLGIKNPGSETLILFYSFPFKKAHD